MDNKNLPIITISREFAAGGRTIAKGLSEKLSIPWYDRDFVKLTSKISGYSEEEILEEGEELGTGTKFLDKLLNNATSYVSSHDAIYKAQKESIMELSKSPCIIVGRCSNVILREAGIPTFDIFLYADKDIRIKRAGDIIKDKKVDALKYLEHKDALRETYYKTYTGKNMGFYHDYNICLDTGRIDYGKAIGFLADIIQKNAQEQEERFEE
ncbi:MAG: cytidylate kinase-like family protein [Lachnospiraceae bacterium]|nr:cytidylate kinase-like family protein [Lachnospiraceae bacterium]